MRTNSESRFRLQEWIHLTLLSEGGFLAVTGHYQCVLGQREQAGVDGAKESLGVAAGQVGAAYASCEKRVAGEKQFLLWEVETDAAGGVTRGMDDLGFEAEDAGGEAVVRALIERRLLRRRDADPGSLHLHHAENGQVGLVEEDGCAGDAAELRGAADVVDMRMGDDDLLQSELAPGEPGEDIGDLVAGVDDDRFPGLQIGEQGAIAAERADGEGLTQELGRHTRMVARHDRICARSNRSALLQDY
jgi:hypothetical protein